MRRRRSPHELGPFRCRWSCARRAAPEASERGRTAWRGDFVTFAGVCAGRERAPATLSAKRSTPPPQAASPRGSRLDYGNVVVALGPVQPERSKAYRAGSVTHCRRVIVVQEYVLTTRFAGLEKPSAVMSRVISIRPPGTARIVVGTGAPSVVTIVRLRRAASPRMYAPQTQSSMAWS